jgi:membrane dipeptidase
MGLPLGLLLMLQQPIIVDGHIDHAVQVMGIDHVALGSEFDGISVLPAPMKDATSLPELVRGLEARGYSDGDVRKILGENFLRLLTAGP